MKIELILALTLLVIFLGVLIFKRSTATVVQNDSEDYIEEVQYLGGRISKGVHTQTFYQDSIEQFQERLGLELIKNIECLIEAHSDTLSRKRHRLLVKDDYGCIDATKWHSEVQIFANKIVLPELPKLMDKQVSMIERYIKRKESRLTNKDKSKLTSLETPDIYKFVNDYLDTNETAKGTSSEAQGMIDSMNPYDFEGYCASLLKQSGFEAYVTQSSGDQSIDIKADKNGEKWVFQCKLYSQPVGNKAVQEIIAGRGYECADRAAVITNNSYTKSAKELAQATEVKLLHYSELESLS